LTYNIKAYDKDTLEKKAFNDFLGSIGINEYKSAKNLEDSLNRVKISTDKYAGRGILDDKYLIPKPPTTVFNPQGK
jgi:hypothetical protein